MALYRNAKEYGVYAVFGRSVLSKDEMIAMTVTNNVVTLFEAREASKDWAAWEHHYKKGAELLAWAAEQYKTHEAEWLNEYR